MVPKFQRKCITLVIIRARIHIQYTGDKLHPPKTTTIMKYARDLCHVMYLLLGWVVYSKIAILSDPQQQKVFILSFQCVPHCNRPTKNQVEALKIQIFFFYDEHMTTVGAWYAVIDQGRK